MAGAGDYRYQIVVELLNIIKQQWRVEGWPRTSIDRFECIAYSKCLHPTSLLSLPVLIKVYVDVYVDVWLL